MKLHHIYDKQTHGADHFLWPQCPIQLPSPFEFCSWQSSYYQHTANNTNFGSKDQFRIKKRNFQGIRLCLVKKREKKNTIQNSPYSISFLATKCMSLGLCHSINHQVCASYNRVSNIQDFRNQYDHRILNLCPYLLLQVVDELTL